jgi:hypothetical protein
MDVDKIFTAFYIPDESSFTNENKNDSIFNALMFSKIIINKNTILKNINKLSGKSVDIKYNPNLEYIIHNRSYSYIKKVNIEDIKLKEYFQDKDNSEILNIIEKEIEYYIFVEEYEKCIILDKMKNFFNSL